MSLDRRNAVDALNRLAFCVELLEDPRAELAGAGGLGWSLRSADGPTETLVAAGAFEALPGMSAALYGVVDDALHGREPPLLTALERQVPRGLLEVRDIKGLGAKKIRALWRDLEITSMGELEYACRENRLITLKGFGEKTQASVLEQIERLRAQAGLMRLDVARAFSEHIVAALAPARAEVAGEARRGCELVRSVVVITRADDATARGVVDRLTPTLGGVVPRVVSVPNDAGFGWALLEQTGSDAHIAQIRAWAAQKGVALDQLDAPLEEDVYAALGLVVTTPERREPGVPLVEQGRAGPALVRLEDLRGALHNHTTASDGADTLEDMATAATAHGLSYLGITDHSKSATYAHGLDGTALLEQRAAIAEHNARVRERGAGCVLLSGVESDILSDGLLDYPDDVLVPLDVVVASVHNRFGQRGAALDARMQTAARHPLTDLVGHPTGRLLLGRAPAEYDVSALLAVCAEQGCAVELNANPARLDLNEHHLAEAKDRGILVSVAADAHAVDELEVLEFGIAIARRAGLTAADVLNTRSLSELTAWLTARRAQRGAAARPAAS